MKRDGSGQFVCIVQDKNNQTPATSVDIPNALSIFIKWFHLCNAAGDVGPLVVIMAVDKLSEDEFFAAKVPWLSNVNKPGDCGWFYLSKKRAGCKALWNHFFVNVVIPTLKENAIQYQDVDESGIPLRTFFSTDGEAIILNEAMDESVLSAFQLASIDYMKGPPSCTSRHQPLDVASTFRDVKAGVRQVTAKLIPYTKKELSDSLEIYFQHFKEKYPSIELNSEWKLKAIMGLQKLHYVLINKYLTPAKMAAGFTKCGQHVVTNNSSSNDGSTVCFDTIMRQSFYELTAEEKNLLISCKDQVVEQFRSTGRVTNEFLDSLDIPKCPEAANRDELILSRQDVQLITHEDSVTRFLAMRARNDPSVKDLEKRKADAEKRLQTIRKERQKQQERDQKKAEKQLLSEQEKVRRQSLTKLQRQQEAANKKTIAQNKKALKEQEKFRKIEETNIFIEEAMDLLGNEKANGILNPQPNGNLSQSDNSDSENESENGTSQSDDDE